MFEVYMYFTSQVVYPGTLAHKLQMTLVAGDQYKRTTKTYVCYFEEILRYTHHPRFLSKPF